VSSSELLEAELVASWLQQQLTEFAMTLATTASGESASNGTNRVDQVAPAKWTRTRHNRARRACRDLVAPDVHLCV
jgi:hypothetical protein